MVKQFEYADVSSCNEKVRDTVDNKTRRKNEKKTTANRKIGRRIAIGVYRKVNESTLVNSTRILRIS